MGDDNQKKIGYYLLGKTIGQGTFGKVKLATHTLTGQKVAIKILVKEKIIDVADVERVSRQIHILKLIRHPSIIQLYEIIQTSKHLFLIMQYVEKGELFDYIVKQTKLEEAEACGFFKHILSGVSYLHELNIVHRDLKPENLLIDWKLGLKIVDFGLSNTYKAGQLLKTACGSPCYAAPEMISSKKYNGLQVDIWSCGVILFAMVCGYLPFQDSNTSQLYKKILSGQYVLPNFVSDDFKDLLQKILNVNPNKRFKINQIFDHKWCKLAEDVSMHKGIIVGYHRIPVDKSILQRLKQYEFDVDYAERCIQANKHNHITTAYYLLLKKNLKNGYHSECDLSSPNFNYNSVEPFKNINIEKKYYFFGTNQETPFINLQNIDIKINSKHSKLLQSGKNMEKSIDKKKKLCLHLQQRSNNFFIKEKEKEKEKEKDKTIKDKQKRESQVIGGASKKMTELKMYLRPDKKKQFYSQIKRRQQRRYHMQSLYNQRNQNDKSDSVHVIRMNTDYSHDKREDVQSKRTKGSSKINGRLKQHTMIKDKLT